MQMDNILIVYLLQPGYETEKVINKYSGMYLVYSQKEVLLLLSL